MGLSPLITRDGRPLVRAAPGWRRSVEPGRTRVEDGPYRVVVSWVGDEGFRAAARLAECLENGRLARGEQAEITYEALTPEPAWGFEARLLTPAQWSFRDAMGRRLVLRCPSPSRLLKPALEYLYRGEEYERAARLVDWHTGVTGGELRPVTVSIGRERSTAWAVQGWIQVSLSHGAPGRAAGLLGLLARLLAYTGTGKSRRIGLGMAETRAIPGRI